MKSSNAPGDLYVGSGVIAKGRISVPGEATINGAVEGELNAKSVTVQAAGVVTGNASAATITVAGRINQSTTARQMLVIESTGILTGEVAYGELEIRKGGELQGSIKMLK